MKTIKIICLVFAFCIAAIIRVEATEQKKGFQELIQNLPQQPISVRSTMDFSQSRSLPFVSKKKVLFENVIIDNKPNIVIMFSSKRGAMFPIWKKTLRTVEIPFHTITIDGDDSDWQGIPPVVKDPAGDEEPQYDAIPGTDLANVYMAHDDIYLYFLMTMHDGDPVHDPQTLYVVEFQQYLTQIHTPGDLGAFVSYTSDDGWIVFVSDRGPGGPIEQYPSDHVGIGTGMLEWKVPITGMQFPPDTPAPYFSPTPPPPGIENQFIRIYIHPGPHPDAPDPSDTNEDLTRPMIINFYPE